MWAQKHRKHQLPWVTSTPFLSVNNRWDQNAFKLGKIMTANEIFIVLHLKLVSCSQIHNTVKNKAVCISRNIAGKLHVFFCYYILSTTTISIPPWHLASWVHDKTEFTGQRVKEGWKQKDIYLQFCILQTLFMSNTAIHIWPATVHVWETVLKTVIWQRQQKHTARTFAEQKCV